ncbi:MAG: transglycosylase SLT domain-containing protein [Pseudomonadota bacterium]
MQILRQAVERHGQPPEMYQFLTHIMRAESGGDNYAKNPNSTATGIFQFIRSTWAQYGNGGDIHDPVAQCDAVVRFTMDNDKVLRGVLGRAPTAGEYYLAHFAGPGGARAVLGASPSTSIRSLLGDGVITANASIKFKGKQFADFTSGDLQEWASSRMGVDMDAREAYAARRKSGKTTTQEDAEELAVRRQNLESFGFSDTAMSALGIGGLLGDFFMSLIKFFLNETAPASERTQDTEVSKLPPSIQQSQVAAAVVKAPAKTRQAERA